MKPKNLVAVGKIVADELANCGAIELRFRHADGRTANYYFPYQPLDAPVIRGVHRVKIGDLREPTFVRPVTLYVLDLRLHLQITRGKLRAFGDTAWWPADSLAALESDAENEGDALVDGSPDTPQGREGLREAAESGGFDADPDLDPRED